MAGQGAAQPGRGQESELAFAQRKLEDIYGKVHRQLSQWRGALEVVQEVLVWKRPVPAALLYLAVHWLFLWVFKLHSLHLMLLYNHSCVAELVHPHVLVILFLGTYLAILPPTTKVSCLNWAIYCFGYWLEMPYGELLQKMVRDWSQTIQGQSPCAACMHT